MENQTEFIQLRVTKEFKDAVSKQAESMGITMSSYLKTLIYNALNNVTTNKIV